MGNHPQKSREFEGGKLLFDCEVFAEGDKAEVILGFGTDGAFPDNQRRDALACFGVCDAEDEDV
jgi:hypothetical protein